MGTSAVKKLVETLDSYIPDPERAIDGAFLMPIEDVFSIQGRGTVVTGRVERGIVRTGDEVAIIGLKDTIKTTCTGVEMFRKILDEGRAGENVGVLLRGTKRDEVERGRYWLNPVLSPHPVPIWKCTYWAKMKVVVILHSSKATVHSSTSVLRT